MYAGWVEMNNPKEEVPM